MSADRPPRPPASARPPRTKQIAASLFIGCGAISVIALRCDREQPFVGVYDVVRLTRNTEGCDSEGPPVPSGAKCMFLREDVSFGQPLLWGGAARSLAQCNEGLNGKRGVSVDVALAFAIEPRSKTPRGEMGQSALPEDGVCRATADTLKLFRLDGDLVRVEMRTTRVTYPGQKLSDCSTGDSIRAAAGKPCNELVVIEARRR